MKTFDLVQLARVKPIDVESSTLETTRFYEGVVGGLINEKLVVDYLEVTSYVDSLPPVRQPDWLKSLSNMIFFEAQRRGMVDEIEALR